VVNRHYALYIGWIRDTEIVAKIIIEHTQVIEQIYEILIIYLVYCTA
jgi:hypothetical protein